VDDVVDATVVDATVVNDAEGVHLTSLLQTWR
jgi:hypothetical protein